jgi:three-Cys-motif partner protein
VKSPEYYRGREQTYLKHFFLERYLERVAYNVLSFANEFVYVDGFSGPWKSEDEALDDTSFMIAIKKLRQVREGLEKAGRKPKIRCLFIEKDPEAFLTLKAAVGAIADMEVKPLHGEFEACIPQVLDFVGKSFSLVFIDPTGWTGFGLSQIAPILRHKPGEVIVNFMFDYINRFIELPSPDMVAQFNELFGGNGWEPAVKETHSRESAIVDLYRTRMRDAGKFEHATYTRILKPLQDRSYFYLVYGTRHPKGLVEFRAVEKKAIEEQERVRLVAQQDDRVTRTGQTELFSAEDSGPVRSFEAEKGAQLRTAEALLRDVVRKQSRVSFQDACAVVLELPLVWQSDVSDLALALRRAGIIEIEGMTPREKTLKKHHALSWRTKH